MRRFALRLAWTVLVACPSLARAGDGPPPLTPPVVTPPAVSPPAEITPPRDARPIPDNRPMLVIPGVTTPRPGSKPRVAAPTTPTPNPISTPAATPGPAPVTTPLPPLFGPSQATRSQAPAVPPAPARAVTAPHVELDEPIESPDLPGAKPGPSRTVRRPVEGSPDDPPATRPAPPRRPQGFFGRVFPPLPSGRAGSDERIRVEPRSDPATEAAFKRRIEGQIEDKLGGHLRSYEVRVVGRSVVIRARSARFWQRRANRIALESLPALSGYKATILVDE